MSKFKGDVRPMIEFAMFVDENSALLIFETQPKRRTECKRAKEVEVSKRIIDLIIILLL